MSLFALLHDLTHCTGDAEDLRRLRQEARALLAALAEPPDGAAMERRAQVALSPAMVEAEMEDDLRDALARDVQTLLTDRLRARTALEDAAPDLKAIRRQHTADEGSWTEEEEQQAELHQHRAALLGLCDLLALTVAKAEQERDQAAIASLQRLKAAVARVEQRHAVEAERDAALKSAAAWEIQAQDAADRARRAEEERDSLRANQDAIFNRIREGLYLPESEYDPDWLLNRVATIARLQQEQQQELAALRARVDVPWREGLPSVEAVRAHEARGGRWQAHRDYGDGGRASEAIIGDIGYHPPAPYLDEWHVSFPDNDLRFRGRTAVLTTFAEDWAARGWAFRPCTPDGTPLPWPEAPGT